MNRVFNEFVRFFINLRRSQFYSESDRRRETPDVRAPDSFTISREEFHVGMTGMAVAAARENSAAFVAVVRIRFSQPSQNLPLS